MRAVSEVGCNTYDIEVYPLIEVLGLLFFSPRK
jgi:hypothetical protein